MWTVEAEMWTVEAEMWNILGGRAPFARGFRPTGARIFPLSREASLRILRPAK